MNLVQAQAPVGVLQDGPVTGGKEIAVCFSASWHVDDDGFSAITGDMVQAMAMGEVCIAGTELSTKIGRVADAVCHFESMRHGRRKGKYDEIAVIAATSPGPGWKRSGRNDKVGGNGSSGEPFLIRKVLAAWTRVTGYNGSIFPSNRSFSRSTRFPESKA